MSSIAGLVGFLNSPAYCAAKGGIVNLTRAVACELAAAWHHRQFDRTGSGRNSDQRPVQLAHSRGRRASQVPERAHAERRLVLQSRGHDRDAGLPRVRRIECRDRRDDPDRRRMVRMVNLGGNRPMTVLDPLSDTCCGRRRRPACCATSRACSQRLDSTRSKLRPHVKTAKCVEVVTPRSARPARRDHRVDAEGGRAVLRGRHSPTSSTRSASRPASSTSRWRCAARLRLTLITDIRSRRAQAIAATRRSSGQPFAV